MFNATLHLLFSRQYVPLHRLVIRIWSWVLWPYLLSSWHAVEKTYTLLWLSVLLEMPFEIACANFHLLSTVVPLTGSRYCVCSLYFIFRKKIYTVNTQNCLCMYLCVRQLIISTPWDRNDNIGIGYMCLYCYPHHPFFSLPWQPWPEEALERVANSFLESLEMSENERHEVIHICKTFHTSAKQLSERYDTVIYNFYIQR